MPSAMYDLAEILLTAVVLSGGSAAAQSPATSSFVPVKDGKLYYDECGGGSQDVVLLHDGVVDSAVWGLVWPDFCRRFHTIRYDRRGYGKSPASRSTYSEIEDLTAVLDHVKAHHVSIVGSSHGGQLAIDYTLARPDRVDKLVLVGRCDSARCSALSGGKPGLLGKCLEESDGSR